MGAGKVAEPAATGAAPAKPADAATNRKSSAAAGSAAESSAERLPTPGTPDAVEGPSSAAAAAAATLDAAEAPPPLRAPASPGQDAGAADASQRHGAAPASPEAQPSMRLSDAAPATAGEEGPAGGTVGSGGGGSCGSGSSSGRGDAPSAPTISLSLGHVEQQPALPEAALAAGQLQLAGSPPSQYEAAAAGSERRAPAVTATAPDFAAAQLQHGNAAACSPVVSPDTPGGPQQQPAAACAQQAELHAPAANVRQENPQQYSPQQQAAEPAVLLLSAELLAAQDRQLPGVTLRRVAGSAARRDAQQGTASRQPDADGARRRPWMWEEDQKLRRLVAAHLRQADGWPCIARHFPGRDARSCKRR